MPSEGHDKAVSGESPALEPTESDPRIYVDIADTRIMGMRATPLTLTNRGGDVAHHIQVQAIGRASFEEVDTISRNQDRQILPEVEGGNIFGKNNLFPVIEEMNPEWQPDNYKSGITVIATVTFESFLHRKFCVDVEIIYLSLKDKLQESAESRGKSFASGEPIVKTRHLGFKRLA